MSQQQQQQQLQPLSPRLDSFLKLPRQSYKFFKKIQTKFFVIKGVRQFIIIKFFSFFFIKNLVEVF